MIIPQITAIQNCINARVSGEKDSDRAMSPKVFFGILSGISVFGILLVLAAVL